MTDFGAICVDSSFYLWNEVIFFVLCKLHYFFGTMSKRNISSYFRRESEKDETIDKAEEKTENEFHEEENDARLPNSKPRIFPDEMVE